MDCYLTALLQASRTELPVICVTSILRSCLGSRHFACPASSLKLTNSRVFRAGSSLVRAFFEPGSYHFPVWFVPLSSLFCAIFEPAFYPFRACFVPFSSIVRASLLGIRLISFAEGSEGGTTRRRK